MQANTVWFNVTQVLDVVITQNVEKHSAYLYSMFLPMSLVSEISSPFFIQKLSRWAFWEDVRLHWSMIGGVW